MKNRKNVTIWIALCLVTIIALLPFIYTLTNSFMSNSESRMYYAENDLDESSAFHLIPDRMSLSGYYELLLRRPDYLLKFWNSILFAVVIVIGQVIISSLAGYAFSKFELPFRNFFFFLVIVLMMMPYQVTLVSNYIIMDKMNMVGTYSSIIIPGIFSAFGVFLMRQIIDKIPNNLILAAKMDGAGQTKIFFRIIIPHSRVGIVTLAILGFVDVWNMVEQPLVFLSDVSQYPLSIFLSQNITDNFALSFACGILAIVPPLIMLLLFNKDIVRGISAIEEGVSNE